jgi:nucleoside-diphosphate-sugar epimerase
MLVVGGHGYVGCRVVDAAADAGDQVQVVSRDGAVRWGRSSVAWPDLAGALAGRGPEAVVWLLDGAKHAELERLREFLEWAPDGSHVVFVSTCTVYGDQGGALCDEDQRLDVRTAHARLKAEGEKVLADSPLTWCVARLGALYGVDNRGVRVDRVKKWVTAAATTGAVEVPDPAHWRGWLHRDQAARALWRAGRDRVEGVFNVSSANLTFGQAAGLAATPFAAGVVGGVDADPCDYRVDASRARAVGLLDEHPGEDLAATVAEFVRQRYPGPQHRSG